MFRTTVAHLHSRFCGTILYVRLTIAIASELLTFIYLWLFGAVMIDRNWPGMTAVNLSLASVEFFISHDSCPQFSLCFYLHLLALYFHL